MNWIVVVRRYDGGMSQQGFNSFDDARYYRDSTLLEDDFDERWEIEDAFIYEKTGF